MELKLGFMASGGGSNFQAIVDNIDAGNLLATTHVLITNNPNVKVLERAKQADVPRYCFNHKIFPGFLSEEDAILKTMKKHDVNLIVLVGYMKKIGEDMRNIYNNRILNIHPALLPKYGGKGMYGIKIHRAVLESGDKETGATVHIVNSEYDKGRILAQRRILIDKNDTPETLAERVLSFEHVLYSQVLRGIQKNIIDLDE